MTTKQISEQLQNKVAQTQDVSAAFQDLDNEKNYSFRFGKTIQHWSEKNFNQVASELKKKIG